MYFMETLKLNSGKITGTWFVGTLTWIIDATHFIGLLGAVVGLVAGVMLVIIRWDDFWNCKSMKAIRRKFGAKVD